MFIALLIKGCKINLVQKGKAFKPCEYSLQSTTSCGDKVTLTVLLLSTRKRLSTIPIEEKA